MRSQGEQGRGPGAIGDDAPWGRDLADNNGMTWQPSRLVRGLTALKILVIGETGTRLAGVVS